MSGAIAGANAGAIAAAAKRRREQQEEEDMTGYAQDELTGWEFKIVRSTTGRFRNPETVRKLREEEAKAGWELVEKFDDSRIRFKRRVEKRREDPHLGYDPYRTTYGIGEGTLALVVIGSILVLILFVLLFTSSR